jgi:hypothetical protein
MKTTDAYMNRLLEQVVELLDIPPSYYLSGLKTS